MISRLITRKALSFAQRKALKKAIKASALARRKGTTKVLSKRQTKNLAKLKTKIASNKKALKKISGKDTVYRLQNKKGQGPLMKRVVPPKSITKGSIAKNKPFPVQRHQSIKELKKSMPDVHFEYLDFKRGQKFAFKNPKQAAKWFNEKELEFYKKRGYNLQIVRNVNVKAVSKSQLTFTAHKDLNKLTKQQTKLLNKYNKLANKVKKR